MTTLSERRSRWRKSLEIALDTDELAEAMLTASRSVVRTCMQIRPSEHVLVVTIQNVLKLDSPCITEVTDRVL